MTCNSLGNKSLWVGDDQLYYHSQPDYYQIPDGQGSCACRCSFSKTRKKDQTFTSSEVLNGTNEETTVPDFRPNYQHVQPQRKNSHQTSYSDAEFPTSNCTSYNGTKKIFFKEYPLGSDENVNSAIANDEITFCSSNNVEISVVEKGLFNTGEVSNEQRNSTSDHISVTQLECSKELEQEYSSQIDNIYSDGDGLKNDSCIKATDGATSEDDQRPPLPPRPPPRLRTRSISAILNSHNQAKGLKKYVVWCLICGGFSCLLGFLFLGVYFLLHSYTITVGKFETVPTFVPATLLILTGLCIISLARRRNRYSFLIKISGVCGLTSALTCALVTVTTTVLHMSRLQALRECEYAQKTRTCTCYSDMAESQVERSGKEGVRLVFDSLSDCGVVHGSLYSCLRAIFGLSVAGVLIAVFSVMLVYQLLGHERKKMYWEQLELRCRSLYTTQEGPHLTRQRTVASNRSANEPQNSECRCCDQCNVHRQIMQQQQQSLAWDEGRDGRFWTAQPPGNFYSPNPGRDDLTRVDCHGQRLSNNPIVRGRMTGWSWPRMPWQRNSPHSSSRYQQTLSSPDSQYGFSINNLNGRTLNDDNEAISTRNSQAFNLQVGLPYGVWGPPPPYSNPNSPARRAFYPYIAANQCADIHRQENQNSSEMNSQAGCHHLNTISVANNKTDKNVCLQPLPAKRTINKKDTYSESIENNIKAQDFAYEPSDSYACTPQNHVSNTLPIKKPKKRIENSGKSIGQKPHSANRVSVQSVFANTEHNQYYESNIVTTNVEYSNPNETKIMCASNLKAANVVKIGMENSGFQTCEGTAMATGRVIDEMSDLTESEIYFADESSCNVSEKNDNFYESNNQKNIPLVSSPNIKIRQHTFQMSRNGENNINSNHMRFLQHSTKNINDHINNLKIQCVHNQHLTKEISKDSICSGDSCEKTDYTDVSLGTPIGPSCAVNSF